MKKILIIALFASITSISHGQVLLLQDTFNRGTPSDPVPLDAASPTYSNVPETWTADPTVFTDGTEAVIPGTETVNLPFYGTTNHIGIPVPTPGNLTIGKTYTLQFNISHGSGDWVTAGFGTAITTASYPYGAGNYEGLAAFDNGNGIAISYEGNTLYYDPTVTGNSGTVNLTIQVGASSDIFTAVVNGITVVSGYSATPAPISQVFIGDLNSSSGTFSSLSLTEVPEPSTWAMLLGGVGALFVVQRLRRKLSV